MGFPLQTITIHKTTPPFHFHLLHRQLDISWVITAESSTLHTASSQTQTRSLWCLSESC